jgi:V/A-type H+-transporting ATPase subunit B
LEAPVSVEMLGRIMNSFGEPIDGHPRFFAEEKRNVNGNPINPSAREYPRDFIQTGISSIDCLCSLVRGQKLPIFSGQVYHIMILLPKLLNKHKFAAVRNST